VSQVCEEHWATLREAIEERGLSEFISDDGAKAARRTAEQIEKGAVTIKTFDPLLGAWGAIMGNAVSVGGIAVMYPNEDGSDRCPLCYLNDLHAETCTDPECPGGPVFDSWITLAADDQVATWEKLRASG
jgi:hypothetical protein